MGVVMLLEIPFDTRENWTGQQAPFFPSRNLDSTPSGHGLSQRINLFFSFFSFSLLAPWARVIFLLFILFSVCCREILGHSGKVSIDDDVPFSLEINCTRAALSLFYVIP